VQTIEITVNGEPQKLPGQQTVESLLRELGVRADRVAVELNRKIVSKNQWASTPVETGAALEIVEFVGGG
jgi:thiamine biosynthesis protein ThiS